MNITKSDGCPSSTITAYQNVNNEGRQQASSSTLTIGDKIALTPESDDEIWSWTGPNGFSANTREITITDIKINQGGTYRVTSTNDCGANSTHDFSITVNPPCAATAIVPYMNVNNEGWKEVSNATSDIGGTISFGPQPFEGKWSWSGPNNFSANTRDINLTNIQANQFGTYKATYINDCGAQTTHDFVVTSTLSVSTPTAAAKKDNFYMYPNPNEGVLTIKLNREQYNSLNIFTSTGVRVYSKKLSNENKLEINVTNVLKTGIYFVSLKSNSNSSTKKLIVK